MAYRTSNTVLPIMDRLYKQSKVLYSNFNSLAAKYYAQQETQEEVKSELQQ